MLIVIGGLPGTGKTSLARGLARMLRAVYVRIDTVEQALVDSGVAMRPLGPAGYVVSYALAADNLRLGLMVVADSVNPLADRHCQDSRCNEASAQSWTSYAIKYRNFHDNGTLHMHPPRRCA